MRSYLKNITDNINNSVIPASRARRESFRNDSGYPDGGHRQAGMTNPYYDKKGAL